MIILLIFYFSIFLFGLAVGSFLNVVIFRLESKEPIVRGRSHCPHCGTVLQWYDLVPILSFLIQRGKCRYCRKKISWQYPIVEIATGILFLMPVILSPAVLRGEESYYIELFYYLIITCFLIIIFVYDLKHYLIPDKIILPAIIIALLYLIFIVPDSLLSHFLSAFGATVFFLMPVLITRGKGMGWGDVKLAFLMGLLLGWPNILIALLVAFFSGALVGIGLIMAGKKTLKSAIPFGPFLTAATLLLLLVGQYFNDWFQCLLSF